MEKEKENILKDLQDNLSSPEKINNNIEEAIKLKQSGNEQFQVGDFDQAIELYNKALLFVTKMNTRNEEIKQEIDNLCFTLHNNLCTALMKKSNYERAFYHNQEALKINGTNTKALYKKGVLCVERNSFEDAEECFKLIQNKMETKTDQEALKKQMADLKRKKEQHEKENLQQIFRNIIVPQDN